MKKNIFRSVAVILILILQGCGAPGQDWNKPVRFPGNPWDTTLSDTGCNINGKYKDRGLLYQQHLPQIENQDNIQVTYERLKKVPTKKIVTPAVDVFGKVIPGETTSFHSASGFFKEEAVIAIRQQNDALRADLMDTNGTVYQRLIVTLPHPMIGCRDGALVMRQTVASGGSEGRFGTGRATEREFRKLPDGSLQIKIHTRDWYFSIFRGLVGMDANKRAVGREPLITEQTLIFPAANISPQKKP